MADFWSVVLGGVISAGTGYIATKTLYKEQRFDSAASDFQSTVSTKLNGVYPVPYKLEGKEMLTAKESRTYVIGAAKKFRPHVKDKQAFDKALHQYQTVCPDPKPGCVFKIDEASEEDYDIFKKELQGFERVVDDLLSFTENKSVWLRLVETYNCMKGIAS